MVDATRELAETMCLVMQRTTANPGIVFGFRLSQGDRGAAYGVIKADLEADERFYMELSSQDSLPAGAV